MEDKLLQSPGESAFPKLGSTPNRIYLRHDQKQTQIAAYKERKEPSEVTIWAPKWVEQELQKLATVLKGQTFKVYEYNSENEVPIHTFTVGDSLTLEQLVMIARNEPKNVGGNIGEDFMLSTASEDPVHDAVRYLYPGLFTAQEPKSPMGKSQLGLIHAIHDLVKHLVIISPNEKATQYGGYRSKETKYVSPQPVYLIDLMGLQLLKDFHSLRQLFIPENPQRRPKGYLDAAIYQHTVGKKQPTYTEIHEAKNQENNSDYALVNSFHYGNGYFDVQGYRNFVAQDFILSAMAVGDAAQKKGDQLDFRFLSYGTGAFINDTKIQPILQENILEGVYVGLSSMVGSGRWPAQIKRLTFCHYELKSESAKQQKQKLEKFCNQHGIQCVFGQIDALQQISDEDSLKIATTMATDPFVVAANEKNWASLDAAIGENVVSEANTLSPHFSEMREIYLDLNSKEKLEEETEKKQSTKNPAAEKAQETVSIDELKLLRTEATGEKIGQAAVNHLDLINAGEGNQSVRVDELKHSIALAIDAFGLENPPRPKDNLSAVIHALPTDSLKTFGADYLKAKEALTEPLTRPKPQGAYKPPIPTPIREIPAPSKCVKFRHFLFKTPIGQAVMLTGLEGISVPITYGVGAGLDACFRDINAWDTIHAFMSSKPWGTNSGADIFATPYTPYVGAFLIGLAVIYCLHRSKAAPKDVAAVAAVQEEKQKTPLA